MMNYFFQGVGFDALTEEQHEELRTYYRNNLGIPYQDGMAYLVGRLCRMLFENAKSKLSPEVTEVLTKRTEYLKNENEELKKRIEKLEGLVRRFT